jgi:predicted RNA-binding Zn-ribbon protein involved in translation (DUF1610 family)
MRFCGKCGAQVSEKAIYCEMCGVKLIDTSGAETSHGTPEQFGQDQNDEEIEELDLTKLDANIDDKLKIDTPTPDSVDIQVDTTKEGSDTSKEDEKQVDQDEKDKKIINLQEVLESEEKVEADDSIKREVLADEDELSKVCPMCGEEITLSKKLLENTPVIVKCLKCGQETKIW